MKIESTGYKFYNLLRFKPVNFLKSMDFQDRLSLLDTILNEIPSGENWDCLYEFFDSLDNMEHEPEYFMKAQERLNEWDDQLRIVNSSSHFVYSENCKSMFTGLIKGVVIYKRETSGNEHLYRLAHNHNLNHLTYLRIVESDLMESGISAFVNAENFRNIEHLILENIVLTENMKKILFSASFPKLRILKLQKVGLSDKHSNLILRSRLLRNLYSLDLSFNILGDYFLRGMISELEFTHLKKLILIANYLGPESAKEIVDSGKFITLQYLDISKNKLDSEDKEFLRSNIGNDRIQLVL